jgi:tetratricopeptide (TPR) repeat protein
MAFFKDLLRRRVPQVMAIYIGASWGLVEFVDFISLRYALSPHLVDLALVGPLLLLPSVLLVTYFHGAPGQDQWVRAEKIGIPVNVVVAAVFLVFFFQGKDLGAATTTVTVTDEEGVETERVIPKTEFRKRITLFFFEAEPADTAAAWLQYGLPIAVLTDLSQDQFLNLRTPGIFADRLRESGYEGLVNVPLTLAREIAEEQHRDHFVMGTVGVEEGGYQATVSLYETGRGRLVEERTYAGGDLMAMADEIAAQLRVDLKIPDLGDEGSQDLPVVEMLTESPVAYRLSVDAMKAWVVDRDFGSAISLMAEAVGEDPTYADAQNGLASLYIMAGQMAQAAGPLQAAMDHIYRLPERSRFVVKHNYYFIVREDVGKAWAVLDMWADLFPEDIEAYNARLVLQLISDDKPGALASLQTILELDPGQRDVLLQIGSLHEAMGNLSEARGAFEEYAAEFPENSEVLTQLAGLARREGDVEGAREFYERALLLEPSDVGLTVGMASVERALGNFEEALAQLEDARAMATTPEEGGQVHAGYESYYHARGQIDAQIQHMEQRLSEAAAYTPGLTLAQQQVMEASTYAEGGRLGDAMALVQQARAQLPPPANALALLAEVDVLVTVEDADGIEAALPGVVEFIEAYQYEIFRPLVFEAQGKIHEIRGAFREAIQAYEEERRLNPSDTSIPTSMGRCHRELGEYEEALSLIQESLRVSPWSGEYNYEIALTYEAMGRTDEARTHIQRALEVWADADPEYRPAQRAREAGERIGN